GRYWLINPHFRNQLLVGWHSDLRRHFADGRWRLEWKFASATDYQQWNAGLRAWRRDVYLYQPDFRQRRALCVELRNGFSDRGQYIYEPGFDDLLKRRRDPDQQRQRFGRRYGHHTHRGQHQRQRARRIGWRFYDWRTVPPRVPSG